MSPGGNCWSGLSRGGRCTDLLQEKVSREECCALGAAGASGAAGATTAWSEKDMDAGTLFFWRVLGGGVPCQACRGKFDLSPAACHYLLAKYLRKQYTAEITISQ